jgi:hypothetical protein
MKILFFIICFVPITAFSMSGKEAWNSTNMNGKVWLLQEYKAFFINHQQSENLEELQVTRFPLMNLILDSAWALEGMDCVYAGWPSKRMNNTCSSPLKQNPEYKSGSCSSGQLQCQPLLFGKGLCVSVATPSERSLAFTNCDKKFQAGKKSSEALIKEIRADGNEGSLFELMDFADKVCREGKQAGSGMCRRLQAAVDRLRHFKKEAVASLETSGPVTRGPAVNATIPPRIVQQASEEQELIHTVTRAQEVIKAVSDKDCEPELNGEPFDRDEPRPLNFDYTTLRPGKDPAWDDLFVKDKAEPGLRPTGFELKSIGPNSIAGDPIDSREKTERSWKFTSDDNSKRETYLWITDDSGSGRISGLMETILLIVPRKMKPKIEAVGEDLHVTLTTGEKVIYDKKTKTIKAGILREGAIDLNPDKTKRKFAPVNYNGTGISIRVNKRGEDPRLIPGNATVTQNGKTCQVPAKELWESNADFKFSDDSRLVEFLNNKCKTKFSL